jgi:Domain of unknown function (DUF4384)
MTMIQCRKIAVLVLLATVSAGARSSTAPPSATFQVRVEKRDGRVGRSVDLQHVFHRGDLLRLRMLSGRGGYLYIVNQSSSGKLSLIFPQQSATDNRIEAGKEYIVPASRRRWLSIEDPPGHEVLYFVLSSEPMRRHELQPPRLAPQAPLPPDQLVPRCDDEMLLQPRGDCIDRTAGAAAVDPDEPLPRIGTQTDLSSRDIVAKNTEKGVAVDPAHPSDTSIVYKLRIAHK